MIFFGLLTLYIWLSRQKQPFLKTYYNKKKVGSLAVNSYNLKMLKTNCFIYKSLDFYCSITTQLSLGFDCVHDTKTTYESPIQAPKSHSKSTNISKYYFYNFVTFLQTSPDSLKSWHSENQRVTKGFKVKTSTQKLNRYVSSAKQSKKLKTNVQKISQNFQRDISTNDGNIPIFV